MLPAAGGIDAAVLDEGQGGLDRVDVVDGEQAGYPQPPRYSGNEPGHPVIAVDEVGVHPRDDIVDDLPLKRQGKFDVFIPILGVDSVDIEKRTVLR
jgi:hypothetical protein